MPDLREKAHQIIDSLSDQKIVDIFEYLQFVKLKEELQATYELTNDVIIMEAIARGLKEETDGNLIALEDIIEDV